MRRHFCLRDANSNELGCFKEAPSECCTDSEIEHCGGICSGIDSGSGSGIGSGIGICSGSGIGICSGSGIGSGNGGGGEGVEDEVGFSYEDNSTCGGE